MGEQEEQQERREKWKTRAGKEAKLNKVTMGMDEDVTTNFIFYT